MRTIPIDVENAYKSETYRETRLVKLDISGECFCMTSWDTKLLYDSEIYQPRGSLVEEISYSMGKNVNETPLKIDDVDQSIYASLGEHGNENSFVTIWAAIVNDKNLIVSTVQIFKGTIDYWNTEVGVVNLYGITKFRDFANFTTSKFSASCRWKKFKGTECQYTGTVTECDRTYDTCVGLGNEDNFGGFPFLPDMVRRKIVI